jgi:hypothetical protein
MEPTSTQPAAGPGLSSRSARDTLDELARLSDDWDSYGAAAPTAVAISAAHGLLASIAERWVHLTDEHALPWAIAPLADGGVQLEWRGPGGAIEVEVGPDGRFDYLIEPSEGAGGQSVQVDGAPASEVLERLDRAQPRRVPSGRLRRLSAGIHPRDAGLLGRRERA